MILVRSSSSSSDWPSRPCPLRRGESNAAKGGGNAQPLTVFRVHVILEESLVKVEDYNNFPSAQRNEDVISGSFCGWNVF